MVISSQPDRVIAELTIVGQEIGGDQPCSLLQCVEATRDLDERGRHYGGVQGRKKQTDPQTRDYSVQPCRTGTRHS